jgi:5-hydroxyisourate hydrolase
MNGLGTLTTHVLDLSSGKPAQGLKLALYRLDEEPELLSEAETNADGRVDAPLLTPETIAIGRYRLVFEAGAYLMTQHGMAEEDLFLTSVPLDFRVFDAAQKYHVPLLLSPYGYSTYRGS